MGCPLATYIKECRRRGAAKRRRRAQGGVLLPPGVGLLQGAPEGPALSPLLHSFIYVARGHPIDTIIDLFIS